MKTLAIRMNGILKVIAWGTQRGLIRYAQRNGYTQYVIIPGCGL